MIDYKQLLIRYIEHIECIEGINFIDRGTYSKWDVELTSEDVAELKSLSKQYVDDKGKYDTIEEDKEVVKWENATKYTFDE